MIEIPTTYIAWHCRACGESHEESRYTGSHPVNCRKCGKPEVQQHHRVLPTNHVWRDSTPKRYDLCSNDKHIQVHLKSMDGKCAGMTFDPDDVPDCDQPPLEVAKEVLARLKKYFFSSNLPKVQAVADAMEACHTESERNRISNRLNEIRCEFMLLKREWNDLQEEES